MTNFLKTFVQDESGASAAEYALILAIVGVGIGAAALTLSHSISNAMTGAANKIDSCNSASATATTC